MTDHPCQQEAVIQHSQRLINSFQYWTKKPLITIASSAKEQARSLFEASFVVVSHGAEADPIFNYGNAQALKLWGFDWKTFTRLPSRRSAEPIEQTERDQLLSEAKTRGYIDNYQGIRISSTGQRFAIEDVILWNVLDENHQRCGQAATFADWNLID